MSEKKKNLILEEDEIMNNVVYAVKGGCGKTTFSIALAMAFDSIEENIKYIQEEEAKKKVCTGETESSEEIVISETEDSNEGEITEEKKPKKSRDVCVIDMDIQGTSLKNVLFGTRAEPGQVVNDFNKVADSYINEKTSSLLNEEKKYISEFCWMEDKVTTSNKGFDVVLASPSERDKNSFRGISSLNYTPSVQYSTFREGLKSMLSVKDLHSHRNTPYKSIIFDMPPNSDGYSDAVFDCILDKKHMPDMSMDSNNEYKYKNNLFVINTLDWSQRHATADFLNNFLLTEMGDKIDKIYIVFNYIYVSLAKINGVGVSSFESEKYEKIRNKLGAFTKICTDMKERLNQTITKQFSQKISFLAFEYNEDYFLNSISQDGICNIEIPDNFSKKLCYVGIDWNGKLLDDKFSKYVLGIRGDDRP